MISSKPRRPEAPVPDVLIRDMPDDMKATLAARARRSLSGEIKALLDDALAAPQPGETPARGVGAMLGYLFKDLDWDPALVPQRGGSDRPPPDFS
jgi:plasmid stability protein